MTNEELTLRDIAGFCPEEAIWKMLTDISFFLLKEDAGYMINADTIAIADNQFIVIGEKSHTTQADMIWALGATAYYTAAGHEVFGGHGRNYQLEHLHVALPILQKTFQSLTPVIHRCLCYNPSDRISLESLQGLANTGLAACAKHQRINKEPIKRQTESVCYQEFKWPEKMIVV